MRWSLCLLSLTLCGLGVPVVSAGDKSEDYLKDGKLTERLEIFELQGGFAGFTGTYCVIEPDGAWSRGPVLPREKMGKPQSQGKLTAKQLAQLASDLASNDLATLPNYGKPVVNPRVIKIRFGKKMSQLQTSPSGSAPEGDKAILARYTGIVQAVKTLCNEKK